MGSIGEAGRPNLPYRVSFVTGVGLFLLSLAGGVGYLIVQRRTLPLLPPSTLADYRAALARGQLRLAAREYRLASAIDHTHGNPVELAEAMRQAGDVEGEIDQYRQARDRWPLDPATHRVLGRVLCRHRRFDEGVASLREAVRVDPRDAETRLILGSAWLDQDRFDEAVRELGEAVRLKPQDARAWNELGVARVLSGDQSGAVQAFAEAVRLEPNSEYGANLDRARAHAAHD